MYVYFTVLTPISPLYMWSFDSSFSFNTKNILKKKKIHCQKCFYLQDISHIDPKGFLIFPDERKSELMDGFYYWAAIDDSLCDYCAYLIA